MSLVHQVLKDIDRREQLEPVVPQAFVLPQENTRRAFFSPWLMIPAFLIVGGIAGYVINQKSPADSPTIVKLQYQTVPEIQPEVNFSFVENVANSSQTEMNSVSEIISVAETSEKSPQLEEVTSTAKTALVKTTDSQTSEPIAAASVGESLSVTTIAPPIVKAVEPKEAPIAEAKARETIKPKVVTATESTIEKDKSDPNSSHFEIHRDDQKLRTQYLSVKNAMRYGQWQKAEALNAEILAQKKLPDDIKNKSLSNQLRIYLEQQKFDQFINFYQQHPQQKNQAWFATLAPGLHMAGAYKDAISSYQQLIKLQPQKADWPVAMASAFEQNQQPEQAMAVLSDVLDRYVLSPSQRQWLEQKRADLR
ncbi:lipopolysaccharide assembly protein LapB [Bacterioplanoides sp. SCSIO 12839]|uniref:tetratricopeptide repeat protein n=1 Tax=Bacterioplanoides sp. SCSIO 12839 TaxID=2829569 RepID=UPI002105D9DD|nr:tetratricopeptide repeat protein [Bacterioplanoides sp. SCSIO 12839]UTW47613.1 hypothetical protein KFF03_13670 [Bacterioplanoides sp. SCSIO 12839]